MTLQKIFYFLTVLFFGACAFAVDTPASCRGVNISAYVNQGGSTPDETYKFRALSRQLKTSLTSNSNVNCYNDLYQSGLRAHSSYWADRLQEEGCNVNDRGVISGYCPSSGDAQRSIGEVSTLDRDLKEDAADMLEDSEELEAEARGRRANAPAPVCPTGTSGANVTRQLRDQLCCGSPTANAGVIRGIENISYNTCIGKIRPTNRTIASAGGALSCLVNAVKAAAQTIWESITSIFKLPGEIWAARSQIWALITQPAARAQFARTVMNQIKQFFTDRVEAFKCYNEYEKAQYLCRLGGQIIITCALPGTFGAFIGLATKPIGVAARMLGTMLSKSPRGKGILSGIRSGTQASLRAAARADNATGNVVSRTARATDTAMRTISRPLTRGAENVARRIETSSSYRNMLAAAYRAERRQAAEVRTARAASRADSDAPSAPPVRGEDTPDAPDRSSARTETSDAPDAPATTAAATPRDAPAPAPAPAPVVRDTPQPAPAPVAQARTVTSPNQTPTVREAPGQVAAQAPLRPLARQEISVPRTAPVRNVPDSPAPVNVAVAPIRQQVTVPRTVTRAPETTAAAPIRNTVNPTTSAQVATTSPAPVRLAASGSGGGGGGGFAGSGGADFNVPVTRSTGSVSRNSSSSPAPLRLDSPDPVVATATPKVQVQAPRINNSPAIDSPEPTRVATAAPSAREPPAGASAAPANSVREPAAAAVREIEEVASVQSAPSIAPAPLKKYEIEAPNWTAAEQSKFSKISGEGRPTLDSRNTSIISTLKPTDEVTATVRGVFGDEKTKRMTVAELLDEGASTRVESISVTKVHVPKLKVPPAVAAKIEAGLLTRTDIIDARVEFASGEVARFAGSRDQLVRFANSKNVKSAVTWSDSDHIAPPITKFPESKRAASHDPVAERYATIPKENITTTTDSDLSGVTIMHGTSSNFRASVAKGPRNIGRGYGGDGLYTTMDDGFEFAEIYAKKAVNEWKGRTEWDDIAPTNDAKVVPEIMVGTINPKRKLRVGVFEIRRDGPTDISKGILSGENWSKDAMLRRTLKENFDVLDLRGAAKNEIPGLPDRMLIFSESAGPDAIIWKPRGTKPPNPVAKALAETADTDASIAAAVIKDTPTPRGTQIVNRILKEQGRAPDELRSVVLQNASRSDSSRKAVIRRDFPHLNKIVKEPGTGREVNLVDAIVDDVHRIGGKRHGAGVYNYSPAEIAAKARRLREYGVSATDREALIRLGHAGDLPPTPELAAVAARSAKLPPITQKRLDNLNIRALNENYNDVKANNRFDDEQARTENAVNRRINQWETQEREAAIKFLEGIESKPGLSRRDNYFAAIVNAEPGMVGATVARLQRSEGRGTARQKVLSEIDEMLDAKTDEIFKLEKAGDDAGAIAAARSRSALEFERAMIEHRDDLEVVNIFDSNAHNDYTSSVKKRRAHSTDDTFIVDVRVKNNNFKACRGSYASLTSVSSMHGGYLSLCKSNNYNTRRETLQLSAAPSDKNLPPPEAGYSRFNRFDVKKGTVFSIGRNRDVTYEADSGDAIAGTGGKGGGVEIFCARSNNCIKATDIGGSIRVPSCDRRSNPLCENLFQIQESVRAGNVAAKANPTTYLRAKLDETNRVLSGMQKDVDSYYGMFTYGGDSAALTRFRTNHPELVSALNLRDEINLKLDQAKDGNLNGLDADTAKIIELDRGLSGFGRRLEAATSRLPSKATDITTTLRQAIDTDPGASAVAKAYREKLAEMKRQLVYMKTHPPTSEFEELRRLSDLNRLSAQKNDIVLQVKNLENQVNSRVNDLGKRLTKAKRAEIKQELLNHITGG